MRAEAVSCECPPERERVRPCHLFDLFVKHDGGVYPCCKTWTKDELRIGHLDDPDLAGRIQSYEVECACNVHQLRKAEPGEVPRYRLMNIELSLACQASCAMCCVGAPSWRGQYDFYDGLTKLLDVCRPAEVLVQGGEVLVQKRSLRWIAEVRERHPETYFSVITNGNIAVERAAEIEGLFDRMGVSIVGFQPETYRKITGLELERTVRFVEEMLRRGRMNVLLKYLITPVNIHEAGLFLDWAVRVKPNTITFADAKLDKYVRWDSWDDYWGKILRRTGSEVRGKCVAYRDALRRNGTCIGFVPTTGKLLGVDDEFIRENDLEDLVFWRRHYLYHDSPEAGTVSSRR